VTSSDSAIDVGQIYARYRGDLQAALRAALPTESVTPDLYDILRYHLGWLDANLAPTSAHGGKSIRPTLCLLSCEAVSGDFRQALPAAVALELLHNFSLIHDDIEDRGLERRGRATVFALWGEPLAVNAGDAMLIVSELALADAAAAARDPAITLTQLRLLNTCCLRLTEGQHLDLTSEGNPELTEAQYFQIIHGKTAALLGCSAQLGAIAGGASANQADRFRQFGVNLGLGFQVQDDVLGIWGEPETTGKPAAADVGGRKVTLPVIRGLRRATPDIAARLAAIYRGPTPADGSDVAFVVDELARLGTRREAEQVAEEYINQALRALDSAEALAGPVDQLRALARSLVGRKS
jgi:geranylgeranyl diphosphate synthase, type I